MDGTVVKADEVISAVEMDFLYGHLIYRKYMPKALKKASEDRKAYPITSGFQTAFAIDRPRPLPPALSARAFDPR